MDATLITSNYSLVAEKLDTLLPIHNHERLEELTKAIISSGKDNIFWGHFSYDALFATVTTILVIILTELIRELFKLCQKKKREKELRKFIKIHLDKLMPYIENIGKTFEEISNKTTVDTGLYILPPQISKYDFKILMEPNKRELYDSFKEKNRIVNILSQIDSILGVITMSETYHEKLVLSTGNLHNELVKELDNFLNLVASFLEEIRKNAPDIYQQMDEYIFLNEKLIYYYKEIVGTRKIALFHSEVLRPVLKYIVDERLFRLTESANQITKVAKKFSNLYFVLSTEINDYNTQFSSYVANIAQQRQKIEENIASIDW